MTEILATTHTTSKTYGAVSAPVVTGKFIHNSGAFAAFIGRDGEASLLALPTIIDGRTGRGPLPLAVAGDVIQVDLISYRIVDEVRGENPRLVRI